MGIVPEYDVLLDRAFEYGEKHHPDAPVQHHAGFANSVAYAVTGLVGGYGGPTMRQHLASQLVISKYGIGAGRCTFEQAVELLEECCYGKITLAHASILACEYCSDDAPGEIEEAERLILTA